MRTLEDIFGLRGHRALVTGASSGLGVQFAEALAIAGADLALVARRQQRLEEVAESLGAYGRRIVVVPGDLSDFDGVPGLFDRCEEALGPPDILINNAGINEPKRVENYTNERWQRVIDMNLNAAFVVAREFARRRIEQKGSGRIVNVTSVHGSVASPNPGLAAYAAAKGGLEMATRAMAVEWAPHGIAVNAIAPGYFPTELNDDVLAVPAVRDRLFAFTPAGRFGENGELRAALLFLVSPQATYVTGSTVFVDGGYTAW